MAGKRPAGGDHDELAATAPAASAQPQPASADLARTATAPAAGRSEPAASIEIGATLDRYTVEKELGVGGMGVVYQAFDPDLERRVALKVLRADSDDAQARLLREARAMARLTHPNVITVHEVGSVAGRDYVAMELVDGHSLAEWLRSEPRAQVDILDAFVAAGRGLAAAHAAGIVHRDFKPHNVLRSRTGKIAVTDFGLAREAQLGALDPVDPMEETARISAGVIARAKIEAKSTASQSKSTPTPLAGLTMTGSVLGTPAYMAPEQWAGGNVTPATDQFAFCVALWEALSGERPFRGDTAEMLRRAVELGPAPLDDSKIPRKLRPVLRRGLDPIPKQRWESMDTLLGEIQRARRGARLWLIGPAVGAVGAVALAVKLSSSSSTSPPPVAEQCAPPAIDPATVSLETRRPEAPVLTAMLDRWNTARGKACELPSDRRPAILGCLDGVMTRLSIVADGVRALPAAFDPIDIAGWLIDPAVCDLPTPPRLVRRPTPELRRAFATLLSEQANPVPAARDNLDKLIDGVKSDPCAVAPAHVLAANISDGAERGRHLSDADQAAQQCEDDRTKADIAEAQAQHALSGSVLGTAVTSKIKLAETAIQRVAQPDLTADLDALKMAVAARADNLDEAIARGEAAMAGYRAAHRLPAEIAAGIELMDLRQIRSSPADDVYLRERPAAWRQRVVAELGDQHPTLRALDVAIAELAFAHGDPDAPARLEALRKPVPHRTTRKVHGTVVDAAGKPVAGATVSAGRSLVGGGPYAALAMSYAGPGMVVTTTSATGEFDLPASPDSGLIVAQLGDRRSPAGAIDDTVKLTLEPTSRLSGRVDLRGEHASRVTVAIADTRFKGSRYELIAPVRPDGTFSFEGAPRAKLRVFAAVRTGVNATRSLATVDVDATNRPVVDNIALAIANDHRVIQVVVRSTASTGVINAEVVMFAGTVKSMTLEAMMHLEGNPPVAIRFARQIEQEKAPASVVKVARTGDAFATVDAGPPGPASACVIGLPDDLAQPDLDRKARQHASKIELRCVPVPVGVEAVVVEVPPWPRLD